MSKLILSPPTFLSYSLGCRTNQAEIEEISLQLSACGLQPATNNQVPHIVLLNTCVVTAKAEKETRQKIRELKKKYPKSFLIVLGCGVTAEEKFKTNLPKADLFIPNKVKSSLPKIVQNPPYSQRKTWYKNVDDRLPFLTTFQFNKYHLSGRKFIKIQDGCDKFCSYCLTCHLRGNPISIPPEKIIEEINTWAKNGIKEIILTGINIGLYGDIVYLLNKILTETKIERISFSSIYPEMLTPEFLKTVINNPRISQYFHLSLQSGSQTVLQRMNRKTDLSRLKQILNRIKKQNPYFTFRADIITGFPEETEEEFQETLDFIKKTKISFAHIFTYSPRKGTPAYLSPNLPSQIKKERAEKIKMTVEKIRKEEAKKMIGAKTNCLIIKGHEGITENGLSIRINKYRRDAPPGRLYQKGQIIPVKITGFEENYLIGEIASLPTN